MIEQICNWVTSKPSPNLPNDTAVLLYPSLGLFEGTIVSLGRGTDYPFQFIGNPFIDSVTCPFTFIPKSTSITKKPKYQDTICYGIDMRLMYRNILKSKQIDLTVLNLFYHHSQNKQEVFFDNNFNFFCGEGGIRTHDTVSRIQTFQACSFDHSDTSPNLWCKCNSVN
jgi:uncharacterized protein YbbC (DUF1343 family)